MEQLQEAGAWLERQRPSQDEGVISVIYDTGEGHVNLRGRSYLGSVSH